MVHFVRLSVIAPFLLFLTYYYRVNGGSTIGSLMYFLFLFLGIICLFYIIQKKRQIEPCTKSLLLLFSLLTITFILSPSEVVGIRYEAIGVVKTYKSYMSYACFFLSYFIGYALIISKSISVRYLQTIGICFLFVSMFCYHLNSERIIYELGRLNQNNEAYLLISVLPYLPLLLLNRKRKYLTLVISLILLIQIVSSAKRGAIVCLLMVILYCFYYYRKETKLTIGRIIFITLLFIICVALVNYYISINERLIERISQMESGEYGARSMAYPILLKSWYESSLLGFMFGHGLCYSVTVWGNFAHNDWLELLCSNGLTGAMFYVAVFISFLTYIKRIQISPIYKLSMCLCIIVWFLKTLFSMGYSDTSNCMIMFLLGVLVGIPVNQQLQK